jgi:hypothetical protein
LTHREREHSDARTLLSAIILTCANGVEGADGYAPNKVSSCGALMYAEAVLLPYGIGEAALAL